MVGGSDHGATFGLLDCQFVLHTISGMHCKKRIYGKTKSSRALSKLCELEKKLIRTYNMQVMEKPANMKMIKSLLKRNDSI